MRIAASLLILIVCCMSAPAQTTSVNSGEPNPTQVKSEAWRKPTATAKQRASKPEKKEEMKQAKSGGADEGSFDCKATSVRVSNLSEKSPSPVALPTIYAQPFVGTCEQADKRAKALPPTDTNYLILGRTTPIEMASGLCQTGEGNRSISRSGLKASRAGLSRQDGRELVRITWKNGYSVSGSRSGFAYTLSGTCKPRVPTT
jgi:hypothetical protein